MSDLVENPEDRFSRDEAHMNCSYEQNDPSLIRQSLLCSLWVALGPSIADSKDSDETLQIP